MTYQKLRNSVLFLACLSLSGCGYTTKSLLPENIRSVSISPTVNSIDLSAEITDKTPFRVYRPGLEVELTNGIINRYIFDGTLKVASADKADAILETKLIDYRRDPLRYSSGEDVQEYRLSITIDAVFKDKQSGKDLWSKRISGDTTFFLSGSRAVSEDVAATRAVEDVARRVVEATIEYW